MSEFPLNITPKEDLPEKLDQVKNLDPKYWIPASETNKLLRALDELNTLKAVGKDVDAQIVDVKNLVYAAANGERPFAKLNDSVDDTDAVAVLTAEAPDDDLLFVVSSVTDPQNAGHYKWLAASGTAQFERGFGLSEDDKALTLDPTDTDKVIPGKAVADYFLIPSKNLFDKTAVTEGAYFNPGGGTVANELWAYTLPLPMPAGETRTSSKGAFGVFITAEDTVAGFIEGNLGTFTAPSGTVAIKYSIPIEDLEDEQLEVGSVSTGYVPFGVYQLKNNTIDKQKLLNTGEKIKPGQTDFFEASKNLFDKTAVTEGSYFNASGGLIENVLWAYTDPMPMPAGETRTSSKGAFGVFITAENTLAGAIEGALGTFTAPVGTAALKYSVPITDLDDEQLEVGSTSTAYVPFGEKIKADNLSISESQISKDSITTNFITVKAAGTIGVDCDFTDLKLALDSITGNNKNNRFIVNVLNGVYDISETADLYYGLRNYTEIIAQSFAVYYIQRKPIFDSLYACFDVALYGESIEYASIQGGTFICYNGKAPIHIDTSYTNFNKNGLIKIVGCDLINENTSGMLHYQNGLAVGLQGNQTVIVKNCRSNGQMWVHNREPQGNKASGVRFELHNSSMPFTEIQDLNTLADDNVVIHNCKMLYLQFSWSDVKELPEPYADFSFTADLVGNQIGWIEGKLYNESSTFVSQATAAENAAFWNTYFGGKFGISDSQIHNYCRNNTATNIANGDLVALDTNVREISVKKWESGDVLYGVALDAIDAGDYGTVQYSGQVLIDVDGSGTAIAFNDELELNTSGVAIKRITGKLIGYAQAASVTTEAIRVKLINSY